MSEELLRVGLGGMQILQQELLYFSAFWFMLGALDEAAVDGV